MPAKPLLSVVIPVYDLESCLEECLDSLAAQSFQDFEVICIDDGSTDGSPAILKRYQQQDKRFKVFTQNNQGPALARNAGIEKAHGEFLMILDSDDLYLPSFFSTMIDRAQATGADVVVCRSCEYDDRTHKKTPAQWTIRQQYIPSFDPFTVPDLKGCLFAAIMGWPWDKLYRTSYIQDHGFTFPDMRNSEDMVFVYRTLMHAQRISVVDEVLIEHRMNREGSVSRSREAHPRCFYEGIVTLKNDLEADPATYLDMKWGFLNWALHHTCWNIQTLPPGQARTQLVNDLFEGKLTALELESHVAEYYSLYPDLHENLHALEVEYSGQTYRRSFWNKATAALKSFDEEGVLETFKRKRSE